MRRILVVLGVLTLGLAFADSANVEITNEKGVKIEVYVTMYQTVRQMGRWSDLDGRKSHYRNKIAPLLEVDPEQVSTVVTWNPVRKREDDNAAIMLTTVRVPAHKEAYTRAIIEGWMDDLSLLSDNIRPLACTKVSFQPNFRGDILSIVLLVLICIGGVCAILFQCFMWYEDSRQNISYLARKENKLVAGTTPSKSILDYKMLPSRGV